MKIRVGVLIAAVLVALWSSLVAAQDPVEPVPSLYVEPTDSVAPVEPEMSVPSGVEAVDPTAPVGDDPVVLGGGAPATVGSTVPLDDTQEDSSGAGWVQVLGVVFVLVAGVAGLLWVSQRRKGRRMDWVSSAVLTAVRMRELAAMVEAGGGQGEVAELRFVAVADRVSSLKSSAPAPLEGVVNAAGDAVRVVRAAAAAEVGVDATCAVLRAAAGDLEVAARRYADPDS